MQGIYDKSSYAVDFSERDNLTIEEKRSLAAIQESYWPIERIPILLDYVIPGKITTDDFETLTGVAYTFNENIC